MVDWPNSDTWKTSNSENFALISRYNKGVNYPLSRDFRRGISTASTCLKVCSHKCGSCKNGIE
jgi:hypothetical protein